MNIISQVKRTSAISNKKGFIVFMNRNVTGIREFHNGVILHSTLKNLTKTWIGTEEVLQKELQTFNPLPYTAAREAAELARSVNTQPPVRRSKPSMSCF
jgi:hypothetical protein